MFKSTGTVFFKEKKKKNLRHKPRTSNSVAILTEMWPSPQYDTPPAGSLRNEHPF